MRDSGKEAAGLGTLSFRILAMKLYEQKREKVLLIMLYSTVGALLSTAYRTPSSPNKKLEKEQLLRIKCDLSFCSRKCTSIVCVRRALHGKTVLKWKHYSKAIDAPFQVSGSNEATCQLICRNYIILLLKNISHLHTASSISSTANICIKAH